MAAGRANVRGLAASPAVRDTSGTSISAIRARRPAEEHGAPPTRSRLGVQGQSEWTLHDGCRASPRLTVLDLITGPATLALSGPCQVHENVRPARGHLSMRERPRVERSQDAIHRRPGEESQRREPARHRRIATPAIVVAGGKRGRLLGDLHLLAIQLREERGRREPHVDRGIARARAGADIGDENGIAMHGAERSGDSNARGSQRELREVRTGPRHERGDSRTRARHDYRLATTRQPLEVRGRNELVSPRGRDDQVETRGDARVGDLRGCGGPRGHQGVVTENHGRQRMISACAPPLLRCCVHEFG